MNIIKTDIFSDIQCIQPKTFPTESWPVLFQTHDEGVSLWALRSNDLSRRRPESPYIHHWLQNCLQVQELENEMV